MQEPTLEKIDPSEEQLTKHLAHLYSSAPKVEHGRQACIEWLTAVIGFAHLAKEQRDKEWPQALEDAYSKIFALKDTLVSVEKFNQETRKASSPYVTQTKQERLVSQEQIEDATALLAGVLSQRGFSDQSPRM